MVRWGSPKDGPIFHAEPDSGFLRYRAADHLAMTDDRRLGALFTLASPPAETRGRLRAGWLRDRSVTSVGGDYESGGPHRPWYPWHTRPDLFHVPWGDYPTYRENASDQYVLGGEVERTRPSASLAVGAGATYEEVRMRQMDWQPLGRPVGENNNEQPLDTLRSYHAWAPGAYAFGQGRWQNGGMILNAGLRAEYWTAGPQAHGQTLPWSGHGAFSLSPRLGIVYPVSVRESFSFSYVRLNQAPDRDLLYDRRVAVNDRNPLGNPDLVPSTMISYEAALKHLFDLHWSLQTSLFYRDVFGQPGARNYTLPGGPYDLRYVSEDEGHVGGFELALVRSSAETNPGARW